MNIGTAKHFSYSLNAHITSGLCMENLEELPFKRLNEQIIATFCDSVTIDLTLLLRKALDFNLQSGILGIDPSSI